MKPEILKREFLNTPAKGESVSGWKQVEIRPEQAKFVPLGIYSPKFYLIHTSSLYFGEDESSPCHNNPLSGSVITMFVLEEVAKMLLESQKMLQGLPGCKAMYLVPWDTWRSLETQQALYDTYFNSLKIKCPELSDQELTEATQTYVSLPSRDPKKPSPHNTGGSVDLTIVQVPPEVNLQIKNIERTLESLSDNKWQNIIFCRQKDMHF